MRVVFVWIHRYPSICFDLAYFDPSEKIHRRSQGNWSPAVLHAFRQTLDEDIYRVICVSLFFISSHWYLSLGRRVHLYRLRLVYIR